MEKPTVPDISTRLGPVSQARVEPETISLFREWTRLTANNHGEMDGSPLHGFFCADTQYITHYNLLVNGEPISHRLSAQLSANEWVSNGMLPGSREEGNLSAGTIPKGSIEVRTLRKIDGGWSELVTVKNNGVQKRKVVLELRFICSIGDVEFDEEMKRVSRKKSEGDKAGFFRKDGKSGFRFKKKFGIRRCTPTLELTQMLGKNAPIDGAQVTRGIDIFVSKVSSSQAKVRFVRGNLCKILSRFILDAREEFSIEIAFEPKIDSLHLRAPGMAGIPPHYNLGIESSKKVQDEFWMRSGNSTLNLIVGQAIFDLNSLRLHSLSQPKREDLRGFIAGVPRYIGVFGRDTLICAWQSLLFNSDLLEPALRRIAILQGVKRNPWRDEEPGRLPHERRMGPAAESGRTNRLLYYGDVTSTPFWIMALANQYRWSGDRGIFSRHSDHLARCCDWILTKLKQGFVYYESHRKGKADQNRNQAWKDSGDAIVDEKGRICVPPLALVEIQGYAYRALLDAAHLYSQNGFLKKAQILTDRAKELKNRFNQAFWIQEKSFYAFALDGAGNPVRSKASNIGHCLTTGIIDEDRLATVVRGLMSEDIFSGWGIRTLSSENPAYDPNSYHRGSVWPVENAMIAEGMAFCGFREEANRITTSQLAMAAFFQHMRLPEVFGGQARSEVTPIPGMYGYANLLQAWSVSAIFQHLQHILGIRARADLKKLYLDPHLPEWIPWLEIGNLRVGQTRLHLRFWREGERSHWKILKQEGKISVIQPDGLKESA